MPRNFSKIDEPRKLEFVSDTMSFELRLLETIDYFFIYLSKKVSFIIPKPTNEIVEKIFPQATAKFMDVWGDVPPPF